MTKPLTTPRTTRPTATHCSPATDPAALFAQISNEVNSALSIIEWAEDEISQATARFPEHADRLFHAFSLLRPRDIGPGMRTEFVFRGHARELLERIAAGADTRPGTAAEICLTLAQVSQHAPMHGAGTGLYFRMWLAAFPDHPVTDDQAGTQVHYEHLHGTQIDDLEHMMRRKTADSQRQLSEISCQGRHHGEIVRCRYSSANPQ